MSCGPNLGPVSAYGNWNSDFSSSSLMSPPTILLIASTASSLSPILKTTDETSFIIAAATIIMATRPHTGHSSRAHKSSLRSALTARFARFRSFAQL